MENFSQEFRDQADFNMAVSYLGRLNNIIYHANTFAMELNMFGWFHALLTWYRSISTEMKKDEKEKADEFITSIEPKLAIYTHNNIVTKELYNNLHQFEMLLMEVLRKSGLLMKMKIDQRFSLGQ